MDSIPDSILTYVVDILKWDGFGLDHIPMTHVCRRFRTVALGYQRLWCRITGSLSERQVELFLERGGECELDVDLSPQRYRKDVHVSFSKTIAALVKHCHRWKRVSWRQEQQITFVDPYASDGLMKVTKQLHNLYLPSLQYLEVLGDGRGEQAGFVAARACRTWSMPNLKSLTGDDSASTLRLTTKISSLTFIAQWEGNHM